MNTYSKILALLPKWWSIVFWILVIVLLCGNRLNSQTYQVGDYIDEDFVDMRRELHKKNGSSIEEFESLAWSLKVQNYSSTEEAYKAVGHIFGDDYKFATDKQRCCWKPDTFENIKVEFDRFVRENPVC